MTFKTELQNSLLNNINDNGANYEKKRKLGWVRKTLSIFTQIPIIPIIPTVIRIIPTLILRIPTMIPRIHIISHIAAFTDSH